MVDFRINETLPMYSQPPNQVEARKRVCEEACKNSPSLVFRGTLETSRRSELFVKVYLFF